MNQFLPWFVVLVGGFTIWMVIMIVLSVHRSSIKYLIKKEQQLIDYYQHQLEKPDNAKDKVLTTIEIGDSDRCVCPYCQTLFPIINDKCPSCGAFVRMVQNRLIIAKAKKNSEIMQLLQEHHDIELNKIQVRLAEINAKREQNKQTHRENLIIVPIALLTFVGFVLLLVKIIIK